MLKYFVFLGAAFNLSCSGLYMKDVIKGNVKPNKVTWFMWFVAPFIATVAALAKGVTWAVVPVFVSGFSPLLVFLSSFVNKKSYWKITRFDVYCGILSLTALIVWYLTDDANYAILFAILSDGLAGFPTVLKAWRHPGTENIFPYLGGLVSSTTAFLAIKKWNFSSLAFPIYLFVVNTFIFLILVCKKRHT